MADNRPPGVDPDPRDVAAEFHPERQWLLTAYDVDKGTMRDFALLGFVPDRGRAP